MSSQTEGPADPVVLSADEKQVIQNFRALSPRNQLQLVSLLVEAQAQGASHDKELIAEAFARFLPEHGLKDS